MVINIIGSFILGVFSILSVSWNLEPKYSLLIATGFCGSLTTMSAFALESVQLFDNQQIVKFVVNIMGNVGLSIGALILARSITVVILKMWENLG
jgi:CrcB protein